MVFKPDNKLPVPTDLEDIADVAAAAVTVMEEIVRLLLRDNEVHVVAKNSHI